MGFGFAKFQAKAWLCECAVFGRTQPQEHTLRIFRVSMHFLLLRVPRALQCLATSSAAPVTSPCSLGSAGSAYGLYMGLEIGHKDRREI